MTSTAPAWKRERHGRMEAARSLLRPSPAPSPVRSPPPPTRTGDLSAETAMWASPNVARVRSRPSNLHAAIRASPSFALSLRGPATPLRATVERPKRAIVQSRTTQATQTQDGDTTRLIGGDQRSGDGIHLGDFGEVGMMTVDTVDFLIRVLEDRKQELLVADGDRELRVKATYAVEEDEMDGSEEMQSLPTPEAARRQLDAANSGGADVTELVRSHSYEALVQLEGILEARHHKLMNDGLFETEDDSR